jgi:hypothetical protein
MIIPYSIHTWSNKPKYSNCRNGLETPDLGVSNLRGKKKCINQTITWHRHQPTT